MQIVRAKKMKKINKFNWVFVIVASILCTNVFAAETTELSVDPGTCWLRERGVLSKKNPISIQGVKTDNGCLAVITDDVFDKRFKFCVYSGFGIARGEEAGYYGCSYSREKNSYMFRAYMSYEGLSKKPDLICHFMCYNK